MGLLDTMIEIGITGKTSSYYENLGYEIPRYKDKHGRLCVKNGTKIIVNVKDLSKGSSAKINVICDCCNKQYVTTYHNYNLCLHDDKIYCKDCAIKLFNTGKNSSLYKKDKTKEERERKRLYPEYYQFTKRVLARDKYTCKCCQIYNKNLEVHHLDGYEWCKEKRTNDTNGITLCKDCHSNFHAIYGNKNNTKEQFEEWIGFALNELKKFNGEISSSRKIYCYEEDKIYNSATEFAKINHLKSTSTIYYVCNNVRCCNAVKGFHLFWYDEYINMTNEDILSRVNYKPIRPNRKKVICLNTQKIYESINLAAKDSNVNEKSISACCNHKQCNTYSKDGKQFQWMFLDEYLQQAS